MVDRLAGYDFGNYYIVSSAWHHLLRLRWLLLHSLAVAVTPGRHPSEEASVSEPTIVLFSHFSNVVISCMH